MGCYIPHMWASLGDPPIFVQGGGYWSSPFIMVSLVNTLIREVSREGYG